MTRFKSRLRRLEEANAPEPCPGPTIRVLLEGRDFPYGGQPPPREVCALCGTDHSPPSGEVRRIIIGRPRWRYEGPLSAAEEDNPCPEP
jgi:hypothetical protein